MSTTPLKDLSHSTSDSGTSKQTVQPVTQQSPGFRQRLPEWVRQLPQIRFPDVPNEKFELIDPKELESIIAASNASPEVVARFKSDLEFLDRELLRLFRQRDFDAKYQQNRYRAYQIGYMVLATLATLTGSFLAVSLNSRPDWVPFLGFVETIIAVMTTFLATISANEPALPLWLENRRKAEQMRREYFRFLMDLAPYGGLDEYDRRRRLSVRVANINRGVLDDNVEPATVFSGSPAGFGDRASTPSTLPPTAAAQNFYGGGSSSSSSSGAATTPDIPLNPNDPSTPSTAGR